MPKWRERIKRKSFLLSSINLAHYLALRKHELREIQRELMPLGLSSLGRCEARVMANLEAVIASLQAVCQVDEAKLSKHPSKRAFFRGERLLTYHTRKLLGPAPSQRWVRIMVTLPTESADDYQFFREILQRGTNCVRINCAKDTAEDWLAMVSNLRKAETETGQKCKLLMDLGGIAPRTTQVIAPDPKERRIHVGDRILLTRGQPKADHSIPFRGSCTIPEVLDQLEEGKTVWIDDGKIGSRVESVTSEGVVLKVIQARPEKGEKLKPNKGINFPDTKIYFDSLTDKDLKDLDFIAQNADIVGYSFVQTPADMEKLQNELKARQPSSKPPLGIIAKIETPAGISNLPEIIVQGAGSQPLGVMIARGDLAVEIGYERLAEMQEEIMWICEAAHVPVIWATQVLEDLAKKGVPSRAEITDAAMAERAECVMLNKGPFIPKAVTVLDDILTRMQAHQIKKTAQLRALNSW